MNNKLAKASLVLFLVTILSKVAAFFVTLVFSYYFGTDSVTDAYYAAGTIPNLVNNSLTICALTLFIPVYAKCKSEAGEERADEFTSNILNAFVLFNLVLFITVCIVSPILAKLVAPGFSDEGLLHTQRMICFLSVSFPITVGTHVLINLCNANQAYVLPAFLTFLNHVFIIILTVILAPVFGIYVYPFICSGAWLTQLSILYFWSNRRLFYYKFVINTQDAYFKYILKYSVPVMMTTAADQINLAADNIISSDLPSGSLSCLGYAHRIFNSINGIVTATLLTIYYPIISKQYGDHDKISLDKSLHMYFEIMLLLTLPVSFFLIGNANSVISVLFNRGAMTEDDIIKISFLFIFYVSGLLFLSMKEFVTRLFYIIGETRKPTMINSLCVALNICLSLFFKKIWGIYGIAIATTIATAICALVESVLLLYQAGGLAALKRHQVINEKSLIQIFTASCFAMFITMLFQRTVLTGNGVTSILSSGCIYFVILLIILFFLKNESTIFIFNKVLKKDKGVSK